MIPIITKQELIALAVALGARTVPGWSEPEERLAQSLPALPIDIVQKAQKIIRNGTDLLGETFCRLIPAEQRRALGAVYTPEMIVASMLNWGINQGEPERIIDPGTGSGRFLVAAGRKAQHTALIGIEYDPFAALLARAHVAAAGMADRTKIIVGDYRAVKLPKVNGKTLFIGNPPYVRHHLIGSEWKDWLVRTSKKYGHKASQLAGLHVHFFLATAELATPGDIGVFITASEWLDVNYGKILRELLLGFLGATNIQIIEPTALPFPGTATTAVITGFEVNSRPEMIGLRSVSRLEDLGSLEADQHIDREHLERAQRWTLFTRTAVEKRSDFVELGEICRVHRGQVTGANKVWIAGVHSAGLPAAVFFSSVTKARELIQANGILQDATHLRQVIDLPVDLDIFNPEERRRIEQFLKFARSQSAHLGFIAKNRKAWWSVGLRDPAPILATYMARRPPAFVRNHASARHLNIAHGLYPRHPLTDAMLCALVDFLSRSVSTAEGRTYAGGLTKFEPREMERLMVPQPELLEQEIGFEELMR